MHKFSKVMLMSVTVPTSQQLADPQFYANQLELIKNHLLNTQQLYGNVVYPSSHTTRLSGLISIDDTTNSTSPSTGAFTVVGGQGILGDFNVGGFVKLFNTSDAISLTSGSLQVVGGASISKTLYANNLTIKGSSNFVGASLYSGSVTISGALLVTNTTDTTITGGGSIVVSGGVDIEKSLFVKGNIVAIGACVIEGNISTDGQFSNINTKDSISTTTGAMQVAGGMGVEKTLWASNLVSRNNMDIMGDGFIYGDLAVQKRIFSLGAQSIHVANSVEGGEASMVFSENPTFIDNIGITKSTFVLGHNVNNSGSGNFSLYASNLGRNAWVVNGNGDTYFSSVTPSTSSTTGSLTLSGGLGLTGAINSRSSIVGSVLSFTSTGLSGTNAVSASIGSSTSTVSLQYIANNTATLGLSSTAIPAITITSTSVGINNTTPNSAYALDITGTTRTTGTFQTSDRRIKTDITPLRDSLAIIKNIIPVSYNNVSGVGGKNFGFIAQQVKEIVPDIVQQGNGVVPDGTPQGLKRVDDFLSLNYTSIISFLVGAVQELSAEVENLKASQPI